MKRRFLLLTIVTGILLASCSRSVPVDPNPENPDSTGVFTKIEIQVVNEEQYRGRVDSMKFSLFTDTHRYDDSVKSVEVPVDSAAFNNGAFTINLPDNVNIPTTEYDKVTKALYDRAGLNHYRKYGNPNYIVYDSIVLSDEEARVVFGKFSWGDPLSAADGERAFVRHIDARRANDNNYKDSSYWHAEYFYSDRPFTVKG